MDDQFDIQAYLTRGVENIVSNALRATLRDPRESAFMVRFAAASRKASQRRAEAERAGEHIPPFLIASITSACNLHCAGCYSRCNHATVDGEPMRQLTDEEWLAIFRQADELGVSFILLAGASPCSAGACWRRPGSCRISFSLSSPTVHTWTTPISGYSIPAGT